MDIRLRSLRDLDMKFAVPNLSKIFGFDQKRLILILPILASFFLAYVEKNLLDDLVWFGFFYLLVILPSSILCSRFLLKGLRLSVSEQAILGFPAATAIFCALFYLTNVLDALWLNYVFALIPLVLVTIIAQSPEDSVEIEKSLNSIVALFFILAASLFFVAFSITTASPSPHSVGVYYQDSLWTVGNTWSIIRDGFPVSDSRFLDAQLSYHMAQNIYLGFVYYLTGIDPFDLHLRIVPLYDLFFLVGIVTIGAKVLLAFQGWRVAIVPLVLLFTAGATSWSVTGYLGHLYTNPLSMFFGFHAYLLLLMLVAYHAMTKRVFVTYTALVTLLTFGTKASLALVLPPALAVYFIFKVATGYRPKLEDILLAIVLSGIVVLLRFSLYSGVDRAVILRELGPLDRSQIERLASFIGISFAEMLAPLGGFIEWALVFGKTLLKGALTLYGIGFALLFLISSRWRQSSKPYWSFFILVASISIFSALWIAFFEFPGGEVYFTWYSVVALSLIFALAVNDYLARLDKRWMPAVGILLLLLGVAAFGDYTQRFFDSPWWRIVVLAEKPWDERATISAGEWEAMSWIKETLPEGAVLISDRRGFNHEGSGEFRGRFFGYSALSGKQFFNEGDDFNRHAVQPYADERWEMVSKLIAADSVGEAESIWNTIPADYLIVSKRFTEPGLGLLKSADPVFENSDVIVLRRKASASDTSGRSFWRSSVITSSPSWH